MATAAAKKPAPVPEPVSALRTLVQETIVTVDGRGVILPAGTAEADLPEGVTVENPRAWSDAPWYDPRVESMLVPRMLAWGAPPAMVADAAARLSEIPEDEREAAILDALSATADPEALTEAISRWKAENPDQPAASTETDAEGDSEGV